MKKSRFSEAQILGILRQQDQGQTVARICREHRLSEPTFYSWKSKFGGMSVSELQRLKPLEDENRRLQQALRRTEPGTPDHRGGLAKKVTTPTARREVASPLQSIRSFAANSQEWAQYRYQR